MNEIKTNEITERVIGAAFRVQNHLGCGFLEKVYENALMLEIHAAGLEARQQVPYVVRYGDAVVGEYIADLVVSDRVIVEIKACTGLSRIHRAQCINYLKASGLKVALLINFAAPRLDIDRIVLDF